MASSLAGRAQAMAETATRESGLSLRDTHHEIGRAVDTLNLAADVVCMDTGCAYAGDIGGSGKNRRLFSHREPVGLIAAITPFNHPVNQIVGKLAPAIAAGAPIIIKPSEKTPLSALALADLAYQSGLPGQMLSVVTGEPGMIAQIFMTHPKIQLLSFTGSSMVGKELFQRSQYRRLVLELGGNDPLMVFPDADIDRAALLAASGAYANSGQRCTAVKRILVAESCADRFVQRLAEITEDTSHGDPEDPQTSVGTVIDEAAATRIERRVTDACASGAKLVTRFERQGALVKPVVLDKVPPAATLVSAETFGPVAPVIRFKTIDDAIAIANATPFGLSAGVCTDRLDWITRCIAELQVGGVNIWEVPGYRSELSPFGGVKDSGLGQKEGVLEAINLYTNVKTVSMPWLDVQ
jgi:aldehyde dehydrogenase (NAD+)